MSLLPSDEDDSDWAILGVRLVRGFDDVRVVEPYPVGILIQIILSVFLYLRSKRVIEQG